MQCVAAWGALCLSPSPPSPNPKRASLTPPPLLSAGYNSVNGIPTCGSKGLLTDALRTTLGFDGFVMSDYDAWANIVDTRACTTALASAMPLLPLSLSHFRIHTPRTIF